MLGIGWALITQLHLSLLIAWSIIVYNTYKLHYDVIKWKHLLRYSTFVRGIHRSPVNSPHKGQWRRALMFPLICAWINSWANNCETGDLRRHRTHYDVIVMGKTYIILWTHKGITQLTLWQLTLIESAVTWQVGYIKITEPRQCSLKKSSIPNRWVNTLWK